MKLDVTVQKDLARQFRVLWTPTLVVVHPAGIVTREWIGFLPPPELLAELELAEALVELRSARAAAARDRLRAMRERGNGRHVAAEALFWEGVAAYRASGNKDDLWPAWREVVARYPESPWALRTTLA
ncbi:MAG TPA: hypothetical protein VF406_08260 [Thermodesulfobacteriota bacterium]